MPNTYTLLETITVGAANASSVTFNSIPQTGYTDLVIKASVRSNFSGSLNAQITFNNTTTGYSERLLYGTGSAALSANASTTSIQWAFLGTGTNSGAGIFSNGEAYIPNYRSSNFKSVSIDSVDEIYGTPGNIYIDGGLWSNTAAITSIKLTATSNSFVQHTTFSLYGISALGVTPTKAPKATGGDIIMTDGTYWYHEFISSGTFTPATGLSCDYLVVAGGGGGASDAGGGGGAGGLRSTVTATGGGGSLESALSLASGTGYTVTVGAGGAIGSNGNNSVFSTITSTGGGAGGAYNTNGSSGGAGGGAGWFGSGTKSGGTGTANQGFAGGVNATGPSTSGAGGGGGTGVIGGNAVSPKGGAGGNGVAISITGSSVTYGGVGGGGGGASDNTSGGNAGSGNAGTGQGGTTASVAGTANRGGGGGGGKAGGGGAAAAGGSGVVIVRYLA
jgi:hypothetical protein